MRRQEEKFKEKEKLINERRQKYNQAQNTLSSIGKRECDLIDSASDLLGIPSSSLGLSIEENKRIIDLRRKFSKRQLTPMDLSEKDQPTYRFPFDIWYFLIKYFDTLSLLKIEKTCKSLYQLANKNCNHCCPQTLTLSQKCQSIWRLHYLANDCPY